MNLMPRVVFTGLVCLGMTSTFANDIEFYENDNGGGKRIGTLSDHSNTTINLKNNSSWKNDAIRSIKLKSVAQGTKIKLFDNPDGKTNDDWVEITVNKHLASLTIPHLERNQSSGDYTQKYYRDNGLNGKVSRVQIITAPASANQKLSFQDALLEQIMATDDYWNDDTKAHRFVSSDANYRFYKPIIKSSSAQQVIVEVTLNHIRGGAEDDSIVVTLPFDKASKTLQRDQMQVKVKMGDEQWQQVAHDFADSASGASSNQYAQAGFLIAAYSAKLYLAIVGVEHGGRENFVNVFNHKTTLVSNAVIATLNNGY